MIYAASEMNQTDFSQFLHLLFFYQAYNLETNISIIIAEKRDFFFLLFREGFFSFQGTFLTQYFIELSIYFKLVLKLFSSVQLFSHVQFFVSPWTTACQASLSITNSRSLLKLMSIESVMPANRLILCRPLLLLPSVFPSIRVFSNESVLHIRWPKYWSFSFNISPFIEYSGLISFRMDWLDLLAD